MLNSLALQRALVATLEGHGGGVIDADSDDDVVSLSDSQPDDEPAESPHESSDEDGPGDGGAVSQPVEV